MLLTHSDINEATFFANKFVNGDVRTSIVQYTTGDNKEMLYDKLFDALSNENEGKIFIEL